MPVRMGNIIRRGTISNEDEAIKDKKMLFLAFKLPLTKLYDFLI
jgi:hypothetical protein